MMAIDTAVEFLAVLERSGLLSPEEVSEACRAALPRGDARNVAKARVQRQLLARRQAARPFAGPIFALGMHKIPRQSQVCRNDDARRGLLGPLRRRCVVAAMLGMWSSCRNMTYGQSCSGVKAQPVVAACVGYSGSRFFSWFSSGPTLRRL